ncbi:MAG: hypothetical protein Greene041662_944, partial [Candidatus Peregrinibacteria bacterium Greene0416_62]
MAFQNTQNTSAFGHLKFPSPVTARPYHYFYYIYSGYGDPINNGHPIISYDLTVKGSRSSPVRDLFVVSLG